jgi:putative phage-type endonuclease
LREPDYEYVTKQLKKLRKIPQPVQRTNEWYEFRHNLITASNAYKAFESESVKNQLIYDKCQPLNLSVGLDDLDDDLKEIVMVNTNSTLHWGQKYEPLSVKIYEDMYETSIEDFGCIRHEKYTFLGASPDGINIDIKSPRYGRMLEIKNIVNREIDGIPKKEYWIQMQMQMEVWGLNECDFLETKFSEYTDYAAFKEDTVADLFEDDDGVEFANVCLSKDEKQKGQIMYFHTKEGKPHYVYKPLDYTHPDDIQKWEEGVLATFQSPQYDYTFMKYIYWKLDYMSCVLVPRNRQWFEANIGDLEAIWATIKRERVTGYDHRAPNKKAKKDINSGGIDISSFFKSDIGISNKCLLQYVKVNKV